MKEDKKLIEDKELVQNFLSDENNKKMAVELAYQIKKEVGDDWFVAETLLQKFKITTEEASARFMVLGAFNLCAYKQEEGIQYYRIDLTHKIQREILIQEIAFHEAQSSILKEKLIRLN